MGFLDKIKTFVGEHGCKVEITSMEHQDPAAMRFPSSAVTAPNLSWYVKVLADVKGTPVDADAKAHFTVVA